jgi:hypothetical protein
MPNTIRFFEPKKPHGGRAAANRYPLRPRRKSYLDFTLKGASFKALFEPSSKPSRPLPPYPLAANLLAAALDAGYGAGPAEMLGASAGEWVKIRRYMRARFECLLSLLRPSTAIPSTIGRSVVVDALEMTEKIHMAFLLGTVFCRVANREWTQHILTGVGSIDRFWHRQVATHQAVCLQHAARAGTEKVQNPDFLFRAGGEWFSGEAKGSFANEDWDILRDGLQQASKLTTLKFFDLDAMDWQDELIRGFSCTQAWFEPSTHELQVTHVDPPAVVAQREQDSEWYGVADFAVLVRALQACTQFQSLAPDDGPVADEFGQLPDGVLWRRIDPGGSFEQPAAIGLVEAVGKAQDSMRLAVAALSLIVPACAAARESIEAAQGLKDKPSNQALSRRWNALAKRLSSQGDADGVAPDVFDFWKRLSVRVAQQKKHGLARWQTLLRDTATTVGVPGSDLAILALCRYVREQTDEARSRILLAFPPHERVEDSNGIEISAAEHGLFVAAKVVPQRVNLPVPIVRLG